jgi:hypothetical protein
VLADLPARHLNAPVLNATGVLVHTNLARNTLSKTLPCKPLVTGRGHHRPSSSTCARIART